MVGIILMLSDAGGVDALLAALAVAGRILLVWTLVSVAAAALWSLAAIRRRRTAGPDPDADPPQDAR